METRSSSCFWFVSQMVSGTLAGLSTEDVGGVAWWAPVGGFVAGVALHRLFLIPRLSRGRGFAQDEHGIKGAWAGRGSV